MPTSNPSSSSFSTYRISSSLNNNSNNETSRIPLFWLNFISGGQVHDGRQNILSADTVYTMDDTNPRLFPLNRLAGTIGAAITCPLEVVKTRLQSSLYRASELENKNINFTKNPLRATLHHIKGVVGLLGAIRREEGVRALWKGLGPNLIGVVPARSIYFAVYSTSKEYMTRSSSSPSSSSSSYNQKPTSTSIRAEETPFVHMMSAIFAGSATAMVTNPIWLVKTRMQLQSENAITSGSGSAGVAGSVINNKYRNSFHCLYLVLKEEGIRGLYKGLSASILGLSESTLQFVTYEALKKSFKESRIKSAADDPIKLMDAQQSYWLDLFIAAATAKLGAAIITYPHEVLRTRLRQSPDPITNKIKYTSLIQATKLIYREEGIVAFYGGMTAHLMRVVPNAAILFISYEVIINVLRKWGQPKDHQGLSDQVGVMTRPPPQHLPVVRKVQSSTSADDSLNAAENAGESKDL